MRVEHAARDVAGLDLTASNSIDLLILMIAFGISNLLTGSMLILTAWKGRSIAFAMLAIIPIAYFIGGASLSAVQPAFPQTQADYPGTTLIASYLTVCVFTFLAASLHMRYAWIKKVVGATSMERTKATASAS